MSLSADFFKVKGSLPPPFMPLRLLPTLCLVFAVNGLLPGIALGESPAQPSGQPKTIANATPGDQRRAFELPTYVHRPLPYTLQTAQDWQTVGMNALIAEDYVNSLQAFNKAVDLSAGQDPEILEQRGWVHYLQERYETAIADLNQAATLYQEQSQTPNYRNVRRMQLYIETQAERTDTAS